MKLIARIIVSIIGNGVALYLTTAVVPGFLFPTDAGPLIVGALLLTLLNWFVKPLLKLLFIPVIILTLGIGLVFVNAIVLALLDFLSKNLTIQDIPSLLYASLIVGLVNFVFHLATKSS